MKRVLKTGNAEIVEKKSRFIGIVLNVTSPEDALDKVNLIKKKYYDARHSCYAYICGDDGMERRFSDDGEPSGTAGKPMMDVLAGCDVTNCLVVVTRYFGGTLLGTGGLVKAYSRQPGWHLKMHSLQKLLQELCAVSRQIITVSVKSSIFWHQWIFQCLIQYMNRMFCLKL